MKKIIGLLLLAVVMIAFNSCKKSGTPEDVAEKYLKAINAQKFEEAKNYVTEESKATIDLMISIIQMGGDEAKAQANEKVEIKDLKCETKDDVADCTCKVGDTETKVHLLKKDGKWLVEQKKEDSGHMDTNLTEESTEEEMDTVATSEEASN